MQLTNKIYVIIVKALTLNVTLVFTNTIEPISQILQKLNVHINCLKFHESMHFNQKFQYSYQYSYNISTTFHEFNFMDPK